MPLHQAAGDDDSSELTSGLAFQRIADHFQRFISARFKEAAGIDHHRIGGIIARDDFKTRITQRTEHPLAVHEVLRAPETDEGHPGGRACQLAFHTKRVPPVSIWCEVNAVRNDHSPSR